MMSTAGNVFLSDDCSNVVYGYTCDGQLVFNMSMESLGFVIEAFQGMFTVFQNGTRSLLAARAVLSPFQLQYWCGSLELITIHLISGNFEVHMTVLQCLAMLIAM